MTALDCFPGALSGLWQAPGPRHATPSIAAGHGLFEARVRRWWAAGLMGLALMVSQPRAEVGAPWPPGRADLTSALRWLEVPDAPPLTTRLQAVLAPSGQVDIELNAQADGLGISLDIAVPAPGQMGSWHVRKADAELAAWARIVAKRFALPLLPADLEAHGVVHLAGGGTWQRGAFSGVVQESLEGGSLNSETRGWSASGVSLVTEMGLENNRPLLHRGRFSAESARVAGILGRNLMVEVAGVGEKGLSVRRAELQTLGGQLALEPFTFDAAAPALDLTATLTHLELDDLASLVPQALSAAHGSLSGKISVHWSPQTGFVPGVGSLRVATDEPATIRLAAAPGFLSKRVPAKINVLPVWLGPLARATAADSPAYLALRDIEEGKVPLNVEKLEVDLYPDGMDAPTSARVSVVASPPPGSQVKTVRFTVNVLGPLDEVLKLGLDQRVDLSLGTRK